VYLAEDEMENHNGLNRESSLWKNKEHNLWLLSVLRLADE
jgi:hypothetical protein